MLIKLLHYSNIYIACKADIISDLIISSTVHFKNLNWGEKKGFSKYFHAKIASTFHN